MPRISDARREAKRAEIVAAARRCFARDGFHQTSMPDIAREAGIAVGASYRYFAGKEELVLEIAGDAFRLVFAPLEHLARPAGASATCSAPPVSHALGEIVAASLTATAPAPDAAGNPVPIDEVLRCAVQAWGELLRNPALHRQAAEGFEQVRSRLAELLRQGRRTGALSPEVDPDTAARLVMALAHGVILQRVAFGLDDVDGITREVHALLSATGTRGDLP
ncbi:TetR/AcrR family transcriptional regulator [Streptacidiphilus cavernicola]|uniref:TetR/AcrR family transcriptional regulator n=1 Tax=Streptacidiphilus cavernicola TaxID=3342716 RepID=A0ABV6W4I7_9ACTN